jgi:predicted N-acyltransferase
MSSKNGINVYHSIDCIKDTIDKLSDDSFFTYGWFKTLESFGRIPQPLYLTANNAGQPFGLVPCFVDRVNDFFYWGPNILPFFKRGLNLSRKMGYNANLLLCYSPACCRTKILLKDKSNERQVLKSFSREIDNICKENKVLFSSFLFVSEFDEPLMKGLESLNYIRFPNVVTFYLDISFKDFEEYLKTLKTDRRRTIRHEIKKCHENEVILKEELFEEDIIEKLSDLGANVSSKYNPSQQTKLDPSFFRILGKYAKNNAKLFVARRNDQVIGFSIGLHHKNILDMYMYGCDYRSLTNTTFIYFNLGYYEPIKFAINNDVKKIYFRYLNEKAKVARGCRPEQTYSFVKCHNTILTPALNFVFKRRLYKSLKCRFLTDYFMGV